MILVNGEARDRISAMDRGLAYGDGIFRTFTARHGNPLHWPRQYAKLAGDAAALNLAAPPASVLEADIATACRGEDTQVVKIVLTRGAGHRGYRYSGDEEPTRIVFSGPLPHDAIAQQASGITVRRCALRLAFQPALAGVKHLNRLENVLARAEWNDERIVEGILCDADGNVVGGTMTNIFIAVGGALATPRIDRCGVAGVTRDRVIDAAARNGVPCEITTLRWDDVAGADEVFLVNSVAGALPVRDLDGQARTPGAVTRKVQRWLEQRDAQAA